MTSRASRRVTFALTTAHLVWMPGPQNAKKKKRAQQKKHHARAHSSAPTQKPRPASPDLSSSTLVTLLSCPPITTKVADEAEALCPSPHIKLSDLEKTSHSFHGTPYGPLDDPTLILLSNPIIVNHGDGPRVRDMRAFLNSWFAQPPCIDDPLCAEFAQREILQMLCTVLTEETALVRLLHFHSLPLTNNLTTDPALCAH